MIKKFLRKLISWAAGRYFPDTVFYGYALKGIESEHNSKIFMSLVTCFPNSLTKVGDEVVVTAYNMTYHDQEIGTYRVSVNRLDPNENVNKQC